MNYGLTDTDLQKLTMLFSRNRKIEQVILYGSRAKGNYKPFSDIDITLIGEGLTRSDVNRLASDIDDLLLPYQFDISIFASLKNKELIEHIKRVGIGIYQNNREG